MNTHNASLLPRALFKFGMRKFVIETQAHPIDQSLSSMHSFHKSIIPLPEQ